MDLVTRSRCFGIVIGFESLDPANLTLVGKSINVTGAQSAYSRKIEVLRDHRLQTWAAFNILMPYPGKPFYRELANEGRLHPEYRFNHAAYVPRSMTPEQLTDEGFRCRSLFNSLVSIIRRATDPKTNMRSLLKLGMGDEY